MQVILFIIVVFVCGLAIVVARKPNDFRVSRSLAMNAPADKIFAQVNDFRNWAFWSPWAKLDPLAKLSFSGPQSGEGAHFAWDGNSKVGAGSMTITESRPAELIRIRLEFVKPFKGVNDVEFIFHNEGGQTVVTWSAFGPNKLIGKIMSVFIDCEKMIGENYEKGLRQLKALVEGA